jgi:hypothetical protein
MCSDGGQCSDVDSVMERENWGAGYASARAANTFFEGTML